jgi:hypothetical protein
MDYPIIIIHDSFGIDMLNVDDFIETTNASINKISYIFDKSTPQTFLKKLSQHLHIVIIIF